MSATPLNDALRKARGEEQIESTSACGLSQFVGKPICFACSYDNGGVCRYDHANLSRFSVAPAVTLPAKPPVELFIGNVPIDTPEQFCEVRGHEGARLCRMAPPEYLCAREGRCLGYIPADVTNKSAATAA